MKIDVVKRKNSLYYYFDYFYDGKRIRKSTGTTNKHIAETAAAKLALDLDRQRLGLDTPTEKRIKIIDFHHHVKSYLENHYPLRTQETYWLRWRNFLRFIASQRKHYTYIQNICKQDIENYKTWRLQQITPQGNSVSKSTINNELKDLRRIFNIAIKIELIQTNVFSGIEPLRSDRKLPHYFSDDELNRLFENAPARYRPFFITLLYTGIRKGELEQLRWSDVDLNKRLIHIRPHDGRTVAKCRPRTLEMHPQVYDAIQERKRLNESKELVFSNEKGLKIHHNTILQNFNRAKKASGITAGNVHSLRHTFATRLVQNHVDIKYISYLLGHSTVKTTEIYTHIEPPTHNAGFLTKNLDWTL